MKLGGLAAILLLFTTHAFAFTLFGVDRKELDEASVVPGCADRDVRQPPVLCMADLQQKIDSSRLNDLLSNTAVNSMEANLDVVEHVFADLLKAKTLELETAQMSFRDGIDLGLARDRDQWFERYQQHNMGTSSINLNPACLQDYPRAQNIRTQTVGELMGPASAARAHDAEAFRRAEDVIVEGDTSGRCTSVECQPLGERAFRAMRLDTEIAGLRVDRPAGWEARIKADEEARDEILASDPALDQWVPDEHPGSCADRETRTEPNPDCKRAYDLIGQIANVYKSYTPPLSERDRREYNERVQAAYQRANREMKNRIAEGVHDTCDADGADMIFSKPIAQQVLRENPGFEGIYCRLLKKQVRRRERRQIAQGALLAAKWTATGIGMLAAFTSTGGAAAPLIATLAASAAGMSRAHMQMTTAHQGLTYSRQGVAARVENPRATEEYQRAEREYHEEFHREMRELPLKLVEAGVMTAVGHVLHSIEEPLRLSPAEESELIKQGAAVYREILAAGEAQGLSAGAARQAAVAAAEEATSPTFIVAARKLASGQALDATDRLALEHATKAGHHVIEGFLKVAARQVVGMPVADDLHVH